MALKRLSEEKEQFLIDLFATYPIVAKSPWLGYNYITQRKEAKCHSNTASQKSNGKKVNTKET